MSKSFSTAALTAASSCFKHLRERASKQSAYCRQTGAHNSDIDLDVRPIDYAGLIPSRVVALREKYEEPQPDH